MALDMAGLFDEVKGLAGQIVSKMDEANQGLADEKAASYKDGYDKGYAEGYAEGKASIVLPAPTLPDGSVNPELQYTQAQMSEAVGIAVEKQKADDQALLAGVQKELDGVKADIEALKAGKDAEVKAAVEAKVAEMVAEFEAAEVDNEALIKKYKVVAAPVEPQA